MTPLSTFSVFISYSTRDRAVVRLFETALTNENFNVEIDFEGIKVTDPIFSRINEMLLRSNCLLAYVTDDSLKSLNVLEELVRAHDRNLKIISVIEKETNRNNLPWFMQNQLSIEFDKGQIDDEMPKIIARLNEIREGYNGLNLSKSRYEINQMFTDPKILSLPFKQSLVSKIIEGTIEELKGVLDDNYDFDLAEEKNFITRAFPIFEAAETVYATSLDRVSKFWKDMASKNIASTYILKHPRKTKRLFVFSSPNELHSYGEILNAHDFWYGDEGLVMVTSISVYKDIIGMIIRDKAEESILLNSDFGILEFNQEDGNITIEAQLRERKLIFSKCDEKSSLVLSEKFKELMDSLSDLEKGEMSAKGFLRWSYNLHTSDVNWESILEDLFPRIKNTISHLVLFNNRCKLTKDRLLSYKRELLKLLVKNKLAYIELTIGENAEITENDAIFNGQLISEQNFKYLILISFPGEKQLRNYYTDQDHSKLRRKLYSEMDENIKYLYNLIDERYEELKVIDNRKNHGYDRTYIEDTFETIENIASKYITRIDYFDSEGIKGIIDKKPVSFNLTVNA